MIRVTDFLSTYMKSHFQNKDYDWVSKELGISPQSVKSRVRRLTKIGVNMPELGITPIRREIKETLNSQELTTQEKEEKIIKIFIKNSHFAKKSISLHIQNEASNHH